MSLELEGWNFEAYPHFKIRLSGFCAITGEGNLGKSAISRFLRAVLFNEFDLARVRAGAKESVCRIAFIDEPHDVAWVERKKSETLNSYEIGMRDGTTRTVGKAGSADKGVPKELVDAGFSLLRTDAAEHSKHNLNFHRQMGDPLFLLQMGEAPLAAFLHKVFRLDGEESALRRMNADAMEIRKVYDKRSKEIAKVATAQEKAVQHLAEVEAAQARLQAALDAADEAEEGLGRAARAVAALNRLQSLREANARDHERLAAMARATDALQALRDDVAAHAALRSRIQAWDHAISQRAAAQAALGALEALRPSLEAAAKEMAQHRRLRVLQARWTEAQDGCLVARRKAAATSALMPPVMLLAEALKERHRAAVLARRWQGSQEALALAGRRSAAVGRAQAALQGLHDAIDRHHALRLRRDLFQCSHGAILKAVDHHARICACRDVVADLAQALAQQKQVAALALRLQDGQRALSGAQHRASTLQRAYDALQAQDRRLRELLGRCPTCHGLPWIAHAEGKLHAA